MLQGIDINELIGTLIYISVTVLITFLLLRLTGTLMKKQEQKNGPAIHLKFFGNVLKLFILILAISAIGSRFDGFHATVNTILASSGILALGISLAAQESLTNIIDGLFISVFRPFNIGDRITLPEKNNLTGTVQEINLRHTVIRTFSNTSYIVPNSVMSSSIIDNSNFKNQTFAYPIDVSVSYDTDPELAMKLLQQAIVTHPAFVDPRSEDQRNAGDPPVQPLLRSFGSSGMELRCMMYTKNVNQSFSACSEVRLAVKKLFDENGIVIPFTTIHFDNPPCRDSGVGSPVAGVQEETE